MRPKRVKRVGKKDILTVLWLLEHPKPSNYMTTRTRYLDIFICLTWLIWRALGQKHIFVILFPIIFLFSLRLSGRAFDWDYFLCEMWERKLSFQSVVLFLCSTHISFYAVLKGLTFGWKRYCCHPYWRLVSCLTNM